MGVYGMVSYTVAQRTHEIGIRMALGARGTQVLKLIAHEGLRPILAGMLIGIVASAGVSRLLVAMLFGLNLLDAFSFFGVSLLLGSVALVANGFNAVRLGVLFVGVMPQPDVIDQAYLDSVDRVRPLSRRPKAPHRGTRKIGCRRHPTDRNPLYDSGSFGRAPQCGRSCALRRLNGAVEFRIAR